MITIDTLTKEKRIKLYGRLLLRTVMFAIAILAIIYIIPPFVSLFAPFIIAFAIAYLLNPLVSILKKKLKVPRRLSSLIIVILAFLGLSVAIGWAIFTLVDQTVSFAKNIQTTWDQATSAFELLSQRFKWLLDYLPGDTEAMLTNTLDNILVWTQSAVKGFADFILSHGVSIPAKVSSGIVTAVVFVMSTYFLTAEYPKFSGLIEKVTGTFSHVKVIKNASKSAFGGYIRSQLLLALLAFAVMFVALFIYGQKYALLIAFALAVIDFLPIIGTIAVLLPWGILCILSGAVGKGIFLLILGVGFFLLRKVVEPKIVGSQTGLSPLLALTSIYLGMKLIGFWGAVLGPVFLMIIISVIKAGVFKNTKNDIVAAVKDIRGVFWSGE